MRVNIVNARRVLFATSCFTSALFLTGVGVIEMKKVLSK